MALAGEGVIAIWNDIVAEGRLDFYEWHNREHMPERVGIPGFRRGRRYVALHGAPEFFTLYETDSAQTLAGVDYLTRLDHPTAWTRRAVANFRNVSRALCRVVLSSGTGSGGLIATWRFAAQEGREEAFREVMVHRVLPGIVDRPGVCGVHLCRADRRASSIDTAEKRARSDATLIPDWVLMVEGGSERGALEEVCRDALPATCLAGAGALAPIEQGLYALQYTRLKTAHAPG